MNPIDFGGHRSEVKVTMDVYRNKLVNRIETKPLCAFSSNMADMLTMVRGWTLLILEVTGQRWRSWWVSLTNVGCVGMLRCALLYLDFAILYFWYKLRWLTFVAICDIYYYQWPAHNEYLDLIALYLHIYWVKTTWLKIKKVVMLIILWSKNFIPRKLCIYWGIL